VEGIHAESQLGAPEDREACRWRGGRGLRFIFYANELIGLGQLRRTLALAGRLSSSAGSPSSLILTGSPIEPNFQMPPRVDTVKLPGRSRDESGKQHSARLELDTDELRSLRSSIALAAATSFQPVAEHRRRAVTAPGTRGRRAARR
jgi:predicted glycosyltransferase